MPQKKKTTRRARRENKARITTAGAAVLIFSVTLVGLIALFVHRNDLISPLAEKRQQVLAEAKKADADTTHIKKYLTEKNISYVTIDRLSKAAYLVRLKTGEEVFISEDKDILKQLTSLQLILARLTMEGKQASRLDFRYDKPVVLYE